MTSERIASGPTEESHSTDRPVKGLPVLGYQDQNATTVELVNRNKQLEEVVLRAIDEIGSRDETDKRWAAIARTNIEQGFMALNRSIFKPGRISLDGDEADRG